ncbi:LamG domain-containing protein [Actinomadura rugatobispora]|uniref:LamG domain-containing protein n=1 Tax=Actinomadura rugatobispora TaxID=1994 RepID=A0ABW1A711_9ACTN|nr:LamG domain-containing protein [Actinomadura rugatobispora]
MSAVDGIPSRFARTRRTSRRSVAFLLVAGIAGAFLQAAATVPAFAEAGPPAPPEGSEAAAGLEAARTGKPVEATALRTETSTTWVNPDGSAKLEVTGLPQRVRRADGSWTGIDLTLKRRSDGALEPVASPAKVAFSGGGSGPLISFTDRSGLRSIQLGWTRELPEPTVNGATATYASVLPDVDLKVTATVFGYSEVLVVKTAEAAKNAALAEIRFSTRTQGVSLRSDGHNGVDAVDEAGRRIFHAGSPRMWDSGGAAPAQRSGTTVSASDEPAVEMPTKIGPDSISIAPDQRMLTDPATRFPVYIDPDFTEGRNHWGYIDKAYPSNVCWDNSCKYSDGDPIPPRSGSYNGAGPIRSLFLMDVDPLPKGSFVGQAVFSITGTWTPDWSCTAKPDVELWQTYTVNGNETWNNFTGSDHWLVRQDVQNASLGHDNCGSKSLEFNALAATRRAAAGGWNNLALGLKAPSGSEDSNSSWMRFKLDPKLTVYYNQRPNQPSQLKVNGKTCSATTWPLIGKMSGRQAPVVSAIGTDPDGAKGQKLTAMEFEWGTYDPATKIMTKVGAPHDTHDDDSGRTWQTAIPQDLSKSLSDGTYYVKARSYDTWQTDEQGVSYWSNPCYFKVDTAVPDEVVTITPVAGEGETAPVYGADTWGGGINRAGWFEIKAPQVGTTNDVAYYQWSLGSDQPTNRVTAGTDTDRTARISVTPAQFGPAVLYVKAYSQAGNTGHSLFSYTFNVQAPDCGEGAYRPCPQMSAGFWTMGEGSGGVSQDMSGKNRPLMFGAPAFWAEGRPGFGKAIGFDGLAACGNTSTQVISCPNNPSAKVPVIRTDQSFTVSAWVNLKSLPRHNMVVVSQSGNHGPGFSLYYKYISDTERYWSFLMTKTDALPSDPNYEARRSISNGEYPAQQGVWTHLTGVYDSNEGTLSLYVNGRNVGETDVVDPNGFRPNWNAVGSVQVGRNWYNDKYTDYLDGYIQDVHIYPGAFNGTLAGLVRADANPNVRLPPTGS